MSEKKERKKMKIGDKLVVLLPHHIQVADGVGPFVHAVVADVWLTGVLVEYNTPNGKRDSWIEMKNLDCYYVDDDDD
jgi:hypothetical protein